MLLTVELEKTLESPLDCKEIQPVHPKGDQSWMFIGRTDAEAETPILWRSAVFIVQLSHPYMLLLLLLLSRFSRARLCATP